MKFSVEYSNRAYRIVGLELFFIVASAAVAAIAVGQDGPRGLELAIIPMWSFSFITAVVFLGRVRSTFGRSGKVEIMGIIIGTLGLGTSAIVYFVVLPSAFSFDAASTADVLTVLAGSFIGFLLAYLIAPAILRTEKS